MSPNRAGAAADYNKVDAEVRSVIPANKLITPDGVQGKYPTLEDAVKANAWPTLARSRGKFMFVNCNCLANDRHRLDYLRGGDGSLKGRVMFPTSKPGDPDAAVILMDDPGNGDRTRELVKAGYMVRTRTDDVPRGTPRTVQPGQCPSDMHAPRHREPWPPVARRKLDRRKVSHTPAGGLSDRSPCTRGLGQRQQLLSELLVIDLRLIRGIESPP